MLLPTARVGIEVVGLDSSAWMLERARANFAAAKLLVDLRHVDLCTQRLGWRFPLESTPFGGRMELVGAGCGAPAI